MNVTLVSREISAKRVQTVLSEEKHILTNKPKIVNSGGEI